MDKAREARLPLSFWYMNCTQALGAANDNIFRWVMGLALVARASDMTQGRMVESPIYIAGIIFAVPFILFSPAAGILADRYSKRNLIIWAKACELAAMALGIAAFLSNSPFFIYTVLFIMTTQSAFFGPCKYGIIPELVPPERLSYANGLIGMYTYLAILIGTVGGGLLYRLYGAPETLAFASTASCWPAAVICTIIAAGGLLASCFIRNTGIQAESKAGGSVFFWKDVRRTLGKTRLNPYLHVALFAGAFFLFMGGFVQQNFVPYAVKVMDLTKDSANYIYLALAFGIGVGSYAAGRMSGHRVELGLVPLGALIASTCLLLLILPIQYIPLAVLVLFILGFGGGLYTVPLASYIQQQAPVHDRGEVIATGNFLSFAGVALSSLVLLALDAFGFDVGVRFFGLGMVTIILGVWVCWRLPDFAIRFVGVLGSRILYRLDVEGQENVPATGGALIVCNHVSYVDALLLLSAQRRRIRFVVDRHLYDTAGLRWFYRLTKAIPLHREASEPGLFASLQEIRDAVASGDLVCVFAEGEPTRTGHLMPFRRACERMMRDAKDPVIPANIYGGWGSCFSYYHGRPRSGLLPRLGRRVLISFGEPLSADTPIVKIRHAVAELESQAFYLRSPESLTREFVRTARRNWFRRCMSDTTGKDLTYGKTLTAALCLASILRPRLRGEERVGIMLPTSVAAAIANISLSFLGKVVVNQNYTVSEELLSSAMRQSELTHVLTSRRFLERIGRGYLPGAIYIEDFLGEMSAWRKGLAFCYAVLAPAILLRRRYVFAGEDSIAALLFTSGSTGEPKGVELSHRNITSNIEGFQHVLRFTRKDCVCGILPFFHSFGLTINLWFPITKGLSVAYHYNPTEAESVGCLVALRRCTLLPATPTLLHLYARKIEREQFASLKIVVAGAEKLKSSVARVFEERFGIHPLEGYGVTELSPVVAVNVPNALAGSGRHRGEKPGTIGRPIPGVRVRIVDPDDLDRECEPGEDGLMLARGPNVMKGYLGRPDATAEVMHDDWYVTGDIAHLDEDGFIRITDRLSRFSKIGGEMVPHGVIEDRIQDVLGVEESVCAVTSLPDPRKGERTVVLLTSQAGDIDSVYRKLQDSDLPKLWLPARKDFLRIEAIPLLGTGKADLSQIREMARRMAEDAGDDS